MASNSEEVTKYFTPKEVQEHCTVDDCWISFLGKVFDLTKLIETYKRDILAQPIIEAAGSDISHWFDSQTTDIKKHVDPETNMECYYTPMGRFIHIPPRFPQPKWSGVKKVWWKNDEEFLIGRLGSKTRNIKVVNTLTKTEHVLEVCEEDNMNQIMRRYEKFNQHCGSYVWKRLGKELDMDKTLEENGVKNQQEEYDMLGIKEDPTPSIFLYFKDDLTVN